MDLIEIQPQFNIYNSAGPSGPAPPTTPGEVRLPRRSQRARRHRDRLARVHGCIISGGRIHRSVLSVGCRINSFSEVEESVLFERVRIGRHAKPCANASSTRTSRSRRAYEIGFDHEADRRRFFVTDGGLVVIPKRAKLEDILAEQK
jgi:glucose-1-phosphate adenylyltransferase